MKQFLIVIACCICNLTFLFAETTDEIIEQATKRLQTFQSFERTPFRLAFSVFLDENNINEDFDQNRVGNFDKELSTMRQPNMECSLRYLAPDKFRFDAVGRNSEQVSVVVSGDSIQTNGKRASQNEDSTLSSVLKKIVRFIDLRGSKDLLVNHRNYTVIDGGDTTIDGIKCRSISFSQSDLPRATLYFSNQNKELIAAQISYYIDNINMEFATVTYKYDSVTWQEGSWLVGYPVSINSESGIDNMRFELRSFKKIENADEGILKITK